jgi:hypothetical protein
MNAVSGKTSEMKMRYSELLSNMERLAEKTSPPREWLTSNSLDNNDPCMLRHTAGCSFDDIDEGKFSLIDLEAYDCTIAA